MKKIPLPAEIVSDILNASPDATIITGQRGNIRIANAAAEALFGYGPGELNNAPMDVLIPEGLRERHRELHNAYQDSPRARPMMSGLEISGRRKDGGSLRVEIALNPIETDDGPLVTSTIRPVRNEDDSEAYFRNLLETAPDAMVIIDERGKIAVVNAQAEKMFGYDRQEMLGHEIEMLLPEELRDRHVSHRQKFIADPQLRPMGEGLNLVARRKDSSRFPVEISLSPVISRGLKFVSSVIRDVTERKRMQDEIIEARQEAERANKANSAFLAAASHDLRQPVQALSLLNGALRRTVDDARALEMIESQQHSLTAMTNLLNSLLDISRLDAGAVTPEVEEFPIRRLIDRLSDEFARQAQHKGLEFFSSASDGIVSSDPNLLAEIIQNLVSNAIRYTDKGRVTLKCVDSGGICRVEVHDTGIGIADDQIDAIFGEFHQCKSPGASKEGFGLGLAIVKRLSDLLQVRTDVDTVLGEGSCFSVSIPTVSNARGTRDEKVADNTDLVAMSDGLVILIEDDVNVANAWGLLLEAEGFRVVTAATAVEAQRLIEDIDEVPMLLISDFHLLDGSTGVEAVSAIRSHYEKEIPAFIVSGDTSKIVKESRLLDNCTLMSKPVDTNRLLTAARLAVVTGQVPQD